MSQAAQSRTEELVLLLTQHQQELFRYIFSLLPNEADARDVLQETSVALLRKFEEYDASKPFVAWAYGFAYLQVMKHRERNRHALRLSDDVVELLNAERLEQADQLNARLTALDQCLRKLGSKDRELVTYRYDQRRPAEEIMERLDMSRRTLFRNLERVRRTLHDCITLQLRSEGWA